MSKCEKCGQELPARGLRDKFGIPIKVDHMMLWLSPSVKKVIDDCSKIIVEIVPKVILLDLIELDSRSGAYEIKGVEFATSKPFHLVGFSSNPVKSLISLNINLNEFMNGDAS